MAANSFLQRTNPFLPSILLVIFYFSEAIGKYFYLYQNIRWDVQAYIKMLVFAGIVVLLLRNAKLLILPFILMGLFVIGQIFIPQGLNQEVLISASKAIFPIILFIYFTQNDMGSKGRHLFFKTFEYLLLFNALLVLIGLLGEINLFQSYIGGRFGYNGLFLNTSSSSYIFAIAIFYLLLRYKEHFLTNWKSVLIIVSALLSGTKIVFLPLVGALVIYIFYYLKLSNKVKWTLSFISIISFVLGFYLMFFKFGIFGKLTAQQGIGTAIFSFRNDVLQDVTFPFIQEHWKWPNYLFGGINDLATRSQMGFFDLFYYWGILGGLVFMFVYTKNFIVFSIDKIVGTMLFTFALIIFLAGNFFENASLAIYVLLLREVFVQHTLSSILDK